MNNNTDLLAVVECLQNDEFLHELIDAAPPQAIVMPFAKDAERRYLFIAIFFSKDNLRKELVLRVCKRVVEILRRDHMACLDGLEILISTVSGPRTERVFRLSVLGEALDRFEEMAEFEFSNHAPAAGISSLVYKQFE
jgi:hypothetical protein